MALIRTYRKFSTNGDPSTTCRCVDRQGAGHNMSVYESYQLEPVHMALMMWLLALMMWLLWLLWLWLLAARLPHTTDSSRVSCIGDTALIRIYRNSAKNLDPSTIRHCVGGDDTYCNIPMSRRDMTPMTFWSVSSLMTNDHPPTSTMC